MSCLIDGGLEYNNVDSSGQVNGKVSLRRIVFFFSRSLLSGTYRREVTNHTILSACQFPITMTSSFRPCMFSIGNDIEDLLSAYLAFSLGSRQQFPRVAEEMKLNVYLGRSKVPFTSSDANPDIPQ